MRAIARLDSTSNVGAGDGIGFHSEFIVFSLAIGEEVAPKVMVEATDDDIYKRKTIVGHLLKEQ